MDTAPNPFSPTFGVTPPVVAGRQHAVRSFHDAFTGPAGAPGRTVLVSGARGVGKTVMLNEFEDTAREQGWLTISESSSPGLLDRLLHEHLLPLIHERSLDGSRLTGLSASVGPISASASWAGPPPSTALRPALNQLLDDLAPRLSGLAITVDEIQDADLAELRRLGEILQFARREGRPLAFAGAGLPTGVDELLRSPGTTFLRRAQALRLADLSPEETLDALGAPANHSGRPFTLTALQVAKDLAQGYPYLIQALGYCSWQEAAARASASITVEDVEAGAESAFSLYRSNVLHQAWLDLSPKDREFLSIVASVSENSPVSVTDIRDTWKKSSDYVTVYRSRLLAQGLITSPARGLIAFAIPGLGAYAADNSLL